MLADSAVPRSQTCDFRELYREHVGFVWRILRRLGVPQADADDLTQEVFVVVHRKLGEFAQLSSVRTWLYGIAFRVASEHRRKAHVRREVATESPELGSAEAPQPQQLDRLRARARLDQILAELDEDKRAVFVFYEIEELSMNEVIEIIGCPAQTAYSRLRAARKHVERAAQRMAAQEQPA